MFIWYLYDSHFNFKLLKAMPHSVGGEMQDEASAVAREGDQGMGAGETWVGFDE